MAVLNPKNAALFVSGALIIAAETYAPVSQFLAMVTFATVSSIGLALPLGLLLMLGSRAERVMKGFKRFPDKVQCDDLIISSGSDWDHRRRRSVGRSVNLCP